MWRLPPYALFPFGVIDRCCSLFIWSGFNNMRPIARSGACCCLYGPLSVSCPLNEKWEKEKADESEMCYILWEEAKWKQGNLGDQYRARSREPAGWSENTKQEASLLLSLLAFFSAPKCYSMPVFFKAFRLVWVLKNQIWKWHYWLWVTCLAISRQPHKSSRGIQ